VVLDLAAGDLEEAEVLGELVELLGGGGLAGAAELLLVAGAVGGGVEAESDGDRAALEALGRAVDVEGVLAADLLALAERLGDGGVVPAGGLRGGGVIAGDVLAVVPLAADVGGLSLVLGVLEAELAVERLARLEAVCGGLRVDAAHDVEQAD